MWRAGLQQKFLIALLLVGILPGITALAVTYWSSTRSLKQSIGSGFQEIARSAALRIATTVDGEIDQAERLALVPIHVRRVVELANRRYEAASGRPSVGSPGTETRSLTTDPEEAPPPESLTNDYLQTWAGKTDDYVRVVVSDRRGATVASSSPLDTPHQQADQPWWQETMRGEGAAYVSSFRLTPDGRDYVFDVAAPVLASDGRTPIGVVSLVVRREVLMKTVLTIRVGETGHGMLVDTEGTPLICPVLPPTSHLIHQALLNQFPSQTASWFVAEDDAHGDRHTIVGAAPVRFAHRLTPGSLGDTSWYAFVRQQADETYAPIYSLLATVGAIGLTLVLALASLGAVIGYRFVAPIVALRRETEELRRRFDPIVESAQDGETARPAVPTTPSTDEIEDLARTFQTMRTALENSVATIQTQQAQLVRRERLASVGQLLAALAHDLRNPLGVIRSAAQLMLDRRRDDQVKEEVARYVIEEVDRLTHRINDFLRYARQKPPEPTTMAADGLLLDALRQWNAQGGHDHIQVDTEFATNLPEITVDGGQVKEALVNLLLNAREAMPRGGRLTLGTRRAPSGAIELIVADTGCGISESHLRRVFEPFFTTKEYGTGLGLTNVKRLVEDNGGTLHMTSQEGVGTACVLYFPCRSHPDTPPGSPGAGDAARRAEPVHGGS